MHKQIRKQKGFISMVIAMVIVLAGIGISYGILYSIKMSKKLLASKYLVEALKKINEFELELSKPEPDPKKLPFLAQEAIAKGKKAVELDPNNPEILFQVGNIYFTIMPLATGAKEWAIRYYKRAIELDPNNLLYQEKLNKILAKFSNEKTESFSEEKQNTQCSCSEWKNLGCGKGNCPFDKMYQTRLCSPTGCQEEKRCVKDESCITPIIQKEKESNNCICSQWINKGCGKGDCKAGEMLQERNCSPFDCAEESRCIEDKSCIYSINQEIIIGNLSVKVINVKYPEWIGDINTEGKFIEVIFELKNLGKEAEVFSLPSEIYDNENRKFSEFSFWGYCGMLLKPGFPAKQCGIIYEVAKDSKGLKIPIEGFLVNLGF